MLNRRTFVKVTLATLAAVAMPSVSLADEPSAISIAQILQISFAAAVKELRPEWGLRVEAMSAPSFAIPITWAASDDNLNASHKIRLVASMIENTFDTADELRGTKLVNWWSFDVFEHGAILRLDCSNE
jgi:hypothetical protein